MLMAVRRDAPDRRLRAGDGADGSYYHTHTRAAGGGGCVFPTAMGRGLEVHPAHAAARRHRRHRWFRLGFSATMASVVIRRPATDAASCPPDIHSSAAHPAIRTSAPATRARRTLST